MQLTFLIQAMGATIYTFNDQQTTRYEAYQLVRNFQLRAELIKITSFERAQKTEQEYQIFSKTYAQVPRKIF